MKLLILTFLAPLLFAQNAEEILKQSDRSRSFSNESKIELRVETYKNKKLNKTERMDVYNKGKNRSLVKLLNRKNQLVLMVEDNMWIYFPKTRKPMRITAMQRMMGEASNGDIANLSYSEDYTATLIREEKLNGKDSYLLELKAKSKASTYRKIHYWVSKRNFLPIKADYFMISGKHFKTAIFEDYQKIKGQDLIGKIRFYKVGQEANATVMNFLSFEKKSLSNKFYNKNYLRKVKL